MPVYRPTTYSYSNTSLPNKPLLGPIIRVHNRTCASDSVVKGANFKDWRYRLKTGKQCTTSLDGFKYKYYPGNWMIQGFQTGAGGNQTTQQDRWIGDICHPNLFLSWPSTGFTTPRVVASDDSAKRQMLKKLSPALSSGVVLGELGKTLDLLRNPAKALRKGLDDFMNSAKDLRRKHNKPKAFGEALAGSWLAYAYGWTPLVSDIEGAAKAVDRYRDQSSRTRQRLYAVGNEKWTLTSIGSPGVAVDNWTGRSQIMDTYNVTTVYRASLNYVPDSPVSLAARHFGFRPEDILPTAWELVPWSFLIDYFTNIGDIITGYSYGSRNIGWANKTVIRHLDRRYPLVWQLTPDPMPYIYKIQCSGPPNNRHTARNVSRAAHTGSFIPTFRWELPGANSAKWLNIAALIAARSTRFF